MQGLRVKAQERAFKIKEAETEKQGAMSRDPSIITNSIEIRLYANIDIFIKQHRNKVVCLFLKSTYMKDHQNKALFLYSERMI